MFYQKTTKFIFASLFVLLTSCNSQIVEKTPSGVKIETKLSVLADEKAKLDEKLLKIEDAAKRIKRLSGLLKRAYNREAGFDTYTPLDFIIDLNEEFKKSLPKRSGDKFIREAVITIPFADIPAECKVINAILETSAPQALAEQLAVEGQKNAQVLKFKIQTCGVEQMTTLVEASWDADQVVFNVNTQVLNNIFKSAASKIANSKNWNCSVSEESSGILSRVQCTNLDIKVSETESAIIDTMTFDNNGLTRFSAQGTIVDFAKIKASISLVVSSSGEVEFKLNKIDSSGLSQ